MATPPTRQALLSTYSSTLRAARSFASYNFRNYFVLRAREIFRGIQAEGDPMKVSLTYERAVTELAMLRRSAIVNQLYRGLPLPIEIRKNSRA
ncbi:hypothetical protein ID866_6825 [Astraeus odoratus]|nr:hypothetical protein ID866_6825 [Astraeus odoratus]